MTPPPGPDLRGPGAGAPSRVEPPGDPSARPSAPGRSPAGPVTIGVDVGTTVTKAVAFDAEGAAVARASRPTEVRHLPGGRCEQDVEQVVGSVVAVLAELATALPGGPAGVCAVAVTGQGDGLWLLDSSGRQVRPAISWLDARAAPIVTRWTADGLAAELFRRTGSLVFPGASGPLLAWLDRHEPAALDRAATAGYCKDVVVQRLSGLRATDVSDASVPFLDHATRTYDAGLLDRCGLGHRAGLLAPVLPAPMAGLTTEAAAATGLPAGTPVVAAPYDLAASALGADVAAVGDGLLILGTTLACQVLADRVDTGGEPAGLTLATWRPGRWLRAMPAMVGSAALDWVLALVGATVADLPALLAAAPAGAGGVSALPFLAESGERAPFSAPYARGRFEGLSLRTGRAELVRAICEAVAYSARHCLSAAGLTGALSACGGGFATPAWAQIFADVLGRPITLPAEPQLGARGAVQAAHEALGLPPLPAPPARTIDPDPTATAFYLDEYARYLTQVEQSRPSWTAPPHPRAGQGAGRGAAGHVSVDEARGLGLGGPGSGAAGPCDGDPGAAGPHLPAAGHEGHGAGNPDRPPRPT